MENAVAIIEDISTMLNSRMEPGDPAAVFAYDEMTVSTSKVGYNSTDGLALLGVETFLSTVTSILVLQPLLLPLSFHRYNDVIMSAMASQITSVLIICSTVCSGADQRKHQALRHWPLWGESTGDRWIPHSKGQYV